MKASIPLLLFLILTTARCANSPSTTPAVHDRGGSPSPVQEAPYASYYQEIRNNIEAAWKGKLRSTLEPGLFPKGNPQQDFVTGITATISKNGEILSVEISKKSGIQFLDESALKAFQAVGPFEAPPPRLLNKKGQVKIRWNFVLKT